MSNMYRDWSQLPIFALARLMDKAAAGLSGRHTSNSLALVCTSWAEAVAAEDALEDDVCIHGCMKVDHLQHWLIKHAQHLRKMNIQSIKGLSVLPWPWKQLHCLSLHSCDLDFAGGRCTIVATIMTAKALTSLHINKCRLIVKSATYWAVDVTQDCMLSALANRTTLQSLSIYNTGIYTADQAPAGNNFSKPSRPLLLTAAVLLPLHHLTQLQLQLGDSNAHSVVEHIGTMSDLQDLQLGALQVGPGVFDRVRVDITKLTALTKLQRLGLRGVDLGTSFEQPSPNAAALLAWLPTLQDLSSLQLRAMHGLSTRQQVFGDNNNIDPDTAYRALTAGSALQHVDLRNINFSRQAWHGTFSTLSKLDSITSLRFGDPTDVRFSTLDFYTAVNACPNLHELQYAGMTINERMAQHTTSLTRLTLQEAKQGSAPQLDQLSQLKSLQLLGLSVHHVKTFTIGLQQLHSLTQLAFLRLQVRSRDMLPAALDSFQMLCNVFDSVAHTSERSQDAEAVLLGYL